MADKTKVEKAALLFISTSTKLPVKNAMVAVGFTQKEADTPGIALHVYQERDKQQQEMQLEDGQARRGGEQYVSKVEKNENYVFGPMKKSRKSSKQKMQERNNRAITAGQKAIAHAGATRMLAAENKKPRGKRKSSEMVADTINAEHSSNLSAKTIQRYVHDGMIGTPPLPNGCPGTIPMESFEALCGAFETFILIEQANGEAQTNNHKLALLVNEVINERGENIKGYDLLNRLLSKTAVILDAGSTINKDKRRV